MLYKKLFPHLADRKWSSINLGAQACIDHPGAERTFQTNPLNDAKVCGKWIEGVHKRLGIDFSFGGYLEDRTHLWRGHYQEQTGVFIHLGVDYNVPAETVVFAVCQMIVYQLFADPDQGGGWGGRVIFRIPASDLSVIYAHLNPNMLPALGKHLQVGDPVGIVGRPEVNGGWYPHLHVQCVRGLLPLDMDGYNRWSERLIYQFPNPEKVI
jgi:murein DD-endopeptidase MepM/ murein hydrolase activator NlpD